MPARRTRTVAEDIKQTRPFASSGQEATIALLRTADVVRRRVSRVVEREGATLQQYNVLRILRGAPAPLSALEIAERLIEETPGVSRLIDRLEADVNAADAAPMAVLSDHEVRTLTALLDRIRAADV